jgi:hypothetical protein
MMHSDVINEYILDGATASGTDWVLTFPTKRSFVNTATAAPPFSNIVTASGACETISFTYFNREERQQGGTAGDFSPLPPGATPNSLCYESTILSFRNAAISSAPVSPASPSLVLGSQNVTSFAVGGSGGSTLFSSGWGDLFFTGAGATTTGLVSDATSITVNLALLTATPMAATFRGLPVLGFMVRTFANGNLSCGTATCQGNYAGSATHAYRNSITP